MLICGPICSGKSTLSKKICEKINAVHIPVSRIVGSIVNSTDRKVLQNTTDYTDEICEALDNQITIALETYQAVIVDGIRQPDIIEYLIALYGIDKLTIVWIDPGYDERRTRWNVRGAKKDQGDSFEDLDMADFEMGLAKISQWLKRIHDYNQ